MRMSKHRRILQDTSSTNGMEHATWNGMEWNETKRKPKNSHNQFALCTKHSTAQCCRCRCLCRRRAQTKNAAAAASSEVERAKSSWVSHTSTACLMRNKMAMEHFCVNTHKHTYILYMCTIRTYIQADLQMYGTYCT